ncbi:septum formation protein [Bradyrhizobium sp. GM5.1]
MLGRPKFVLASGSPRRLSLLNQAGIEPDALRPADVDETPKRGELPRACANRLARAKADAALKSVQLDDELRGAFILSADTVVAVGRRILPKANLVDEAAQCLRLLSGRNHRVYTAITLVTPREAFRQRLVETRVRFKRLSEDDIQAYIGSGEWRGKAGGYAVQGIAGSFVVKMVGGPTPTSSACRSTRPPRCWAAKVSRSASAGSTPPPSEPKSRSCKNRENNPMHSRIAPRKSGRDACASAGGTPLATGS